MTATDLRQYAYYVLRNNYPTKFSAGEIAREINIRYGLKISRRQVHHALREFSRSNKHFSIFSSFFPRRIRYSVYLLDNPFNAYEQ